jgi:acetolactate decarboxylase
MFFKNNKMKKIISIIMIASLSISAATQEISAKLYQCPMKCEGKKTYDKPGKCPICAMELKELPANVPLINHSLHISGAMKNVMMKGELWGTIDLDTISNKKHLYGFGPVENQSGEIMILDGKSFKSKVVSASEMNVSETFKMKASFFAYQQVETWKEMKMPDSVVSMDQLEKFLDQLTVNYPRPFLFRLTAIADSAVVHVVNLPKGTKVLSPEDAHIGQKNYAIENESIELLGFFSTEHKTIFTHHDTFIHIHLITENRKKMGHLESLAFRKGTTKLYLPME